MSAAAELRLQASAINPIISPVNCKDTAARCSSVIRAMSRLAETDMSKDEREGLSMLAEAVGAALAFEAQ